MERPCNVWQPETIDTKLWIHINYAFALVGSDNHIPFINSYDADLYPRVIGLKAQNKALKVYIAVGGWAARGASFSSSRSPRPPWKRELSCRVGKIVSSIVGSPLQPSDSL
jgi:GH18 family chitinase